MKKMRFIVLGIVSVFSMPLSGYCATFDMQFLADGDSRWFDLYSAAFMQLDQERNGDPALDGAFKIESEISGAYDQETFDPLAFEPTIFEELGRGGDAFPNEEVFASTYSVHYDDTGVTGSGIEIAPLTDLTLDFNDDVADDDSLIGVTYDTAALNVSGTITFVDGLIASIDATADVQLIYDLAMFGEPPFGYQGTFAISGDQWELYVNDALPLTTPPYRLAWDVHGTVANLPFVALPGDFNFDQVVDGFDFLYWQRGFGTEFGDFDSDDLALWTANFGNPTLIASANAVRVPESICLLHTIVGLIVVLRSRSLRAVNRLRYLPLT